MAQKNPHKEGYIYFLKIFLLSNRFSRTEYLVFELKTLPVQEHRTIWLPVQLADNYGYRRKLRANRLQ